MDKHILKEIENKVKLNKLLWQYSYEHGWTDELWNDSNASKYYIFHNLVTDKLVVHSCCMARQNDVYYVSKEIAEKAIEEVIKPFIDKYTSISYINRVDAIEKIKKLPQEQDYVLIGDVIKTLNEMPIYNNSYTKIKNCNICKIQPIVKGNSFTFWVCCKKCGFTTKTFASKEKAIGQWNLMN